MPLSAVPSHQGMKFGVVAKSTKGRKGQSQKRWPSLSGALLSSFFGLVSAKTRSKLLQREWPSTTFCLVPSGEKRQVVDVSHKYQNIVLPETLISCTNQQLPCFAKLAKWHYRSAGWGQSSNAAEGGQAESNQLARNPTRDQFPRQSQQGDGTQRRHDPIIERCDLPLQAYRINTVEAVESDSRQ